MIVCNDPDEHFASVPTWLPRTGICLLCYAPLLTHAEMREMLDINPNHLRKAF